jgi:calmodulin
MNNRTPDVFIDILTQEEKNACKENFDIFDKDGDGCLDERELKKYLEGTHLFLPLTLELGQHPSEEEIIKMISEVDQTGRGCISKTPLEMIKK